MFRHCVYVYIRVIVHTLIYICVCVYSVRFTVYVKRFT